VQEYWIADPETNTVETWKLRGSALEFGALYGENDRIRSDVLPGLSLAIRPIFRE